MRHGENNTTRTFLIDILLDEGRWNKLHSWCAWGGRKC